MRRRLTWLALWAGLLAAPAVSGAWEIAEFNTRVAIQADGTAVVTETIIADFSDESRHGIFRDIPVHYADRAGQHFTLRLRVREVTDEAGRPHPYRLETARRYRRIRIGDANQTLSGRQTYRIVYTVQRGAVRFFPDHDECYWNLTGNEWAVPMRRVRAEVTLPAAVAHLRAVAYVGGYGSTDRLEPQVRGSVVVLEPARSFEPYEGLTAAVSWDPGVIPLPSAFQVVRWWLGDNWVYGLPLLVLIGMWWLWDERGRDPRERASQVVEYEPPEGLSPAEAGTLADQQVDLRDITSTVVDLAVRGYLRIEPVEQALLGFSRTADYRLVSLKTWEADAALKPHERDILKGVFSVPNASVELSDLHQVFYEKLPAIREHLYGGLVRSGYLDGHPEKIRIAYVTAGVGFGTLLAFGLSALRMWHQLPTLPVVLSGALSGLIIIGFGLAMPRRTRKGAEATGRVLGFVEFLRRADQDRIRRMADPTLFERCLPYALAFGVAERWARAFEGLYTQPPSWYAGQGDAFSARRFGADLDRATTSMGSSFTSQPRSSGSFGGSGGGGGGFSGGGGGGGGGGAW